MHRGVKVAVARRTSGQQVPACWEDGRLRMAGTSLTRTAAAVRRSMADHNGCRVLLSVLEKALASCLRDFDQDRQTIADVRAQRVRLEENHAERVARLRPRAHPAPG